MLVRKRRMEWILGYIWAVAGDRATKQGVSRNTAVPGEPFVRLCRSSREPEIADNVKFWPTELDPVPSQGEWCFSQVPAILLLKISVSYRTHSFTDVYKRCKKVEQSKGQTTKEPARIQFLRRTRRNKHAGVVSVFPGRGTLCLLVPFS